MDSFILYMTLTGMVLAILTVTQNHGYKKANLYLGGYLFFSSFFFLIVGIGLYRNSPDWTAPLLINFLPVFFLIGPCAFLSVRSLLKDDCRLSKSDFLHFVPFYIALAGMVLWYFTSWEGKLSVLTVFQSDNWRFLQISLNIIPAIVNFILRPLHLVFYMGWILLMVFRKEDASKENKTGITVKITTRYLILFVFLLGCQFVTITLCSVSHLIYPTRAEFLTYDHIFIMLHGLVVAAFNLLLLLFPTIMYGLSATDQSPFPETAGSQWGGTSRGVPEHGVSNRMTPVSCVYTDANHLVEKKRDSQQVFQTSYEIERKLETILWMSQPYRDKNFSIYSLAVEMEIPVHKLRKYFQQKDESFSELKNRLRVAHAINLLKAGDYKRYSMEAIGLMSGFSSTASFFTEFKKHTGQSLLNYIRFLQDEA